MLHNIINFISVYSGEIFGFGTDLIMAVFAMRIERVIKVSESITTGLFACLFGIIIDIVGDVKYDLYGYLFEGVQLRSVAYLIITYYIINYTFLNLFLKKEKEIYRIIVFACFVIYALLYEKLALYTHLIYYKGWKYEYSCIAYPILFFILLCFYALMHRMTEKEYLLSRSG